MGAFDDYLSGGTIVPEPQEENRMEPTIVQEAEPVEVGTYSQDDLVDDKFYGIVEDYMRTRFGVDEFRKDSREEVVNKFLNNMRGFSGGNSVRAVNEVAFLNSLEEDSEDMVTVGKAYELFENMAGVFSGETTAGERAEAVADYVRSTIADPVNLIGFGIGKLFTGVGSKGATKIAQRTAIQAYKRKIQQGASKKTAEKFGNRVFTQTFNKVTKENAAKVAAKREAISKVPDTITGRLMTGAGAEIGVSMATEMAVNVGTAYAYERGLVRTDVQEEISKLNVGLAAIGTLIIGGVRLGGVALGSNKNALAQPAVDVQAPKEFDPSEMLASLPFRETLKDKAARGVELQDLDTDFFIEFLLGNSDENRKGMAQLLVEQGYVYIKRTPEDNISNFIADILKKTDPEVASKFIDDFSKATGITMVNLTDEVGNSTKLNMNSFADIFARKLSDQGRLMNAVSQVAKKLKIDADDVSKITVSDAVAALMNLDVKKNIKTPEKASWIRNQLGKVGLGSVNDAIVEGQRKIIRMIVTAPSTSYLNLVGYGYAAGINTVTDAGLALTYLGQAGLNKILGNGKKASESMRIFRQLKNAQIQRARNLIDTEMTYDAYMSIAQKDPEALQQLTYAMNGGIEVDKALQAAFGGEIDYSKTLMSLRADQGIDIIQTVNFVHAQDIFTKSQEFVYQMDKGLRLTFDKGWNDFFKAEDAAKMMSDPKYQQVVSKAVYETQKATFSLSYKDAGFVPKIIEEARDVAGIGLLVPFGRFFNNTVALMSDSTGATTVAKLFGSKLASERGIRESTVRGIVGLSAIYSLAQTEMLNKELGLAWNETIDPETGAVKDVKYDFPLSHAKAFGRIWSYILDGTDMPQQEMAEILEVLGPGQLTRQLNQITEGLGDTTLTALTGDEVEKDRARKELLKPWNAIFSQAVSGSTRFLDPINSAVGLARGSDYKMVNRKIGNETINNSLRYMDQIIAVVSGEDISEEKFNAATGNISSDAAKQLGYREVEMTDTKKVLNLIGRPSYFANLKTKDPRADNRYNQIFHEVVEHMSSELLRKTEFRTGDPRKALPRLEWRRNLVDGMFQDARSFTLAMMERGAYDINDARLAKMIDIGTKYNWTKIDRGLAAIQEQSDEKLEFKDLNVKQLDSLEAYLEYLEYLKRQAR